MTGIIPTVHDERTIAEIDSASDAVADRALEVTAHPGSDAPGVLIVDREGRIVSATGNVDGYFRDLGALDSRWREGQELPLPVQAVLGALERSLSHANEPELGRLPRVRTRARSGRWLVLHAAETAATDDRPSERVVVVAPAETEEGAWFAVVGYELGSRTAEVVRSLVRGLSTMQSAAGTRLTAGLRWLPTSLEDDPNAPFLPYWH